MKTLTNTNRSENGYAVANGEGDVLIYTFTLAAARREAKFFTCATEIVRIKVR